MKTKKIAEFKAGFKAGYKDTGYIGIWDDTECDVCHHKKTVLVIDSTMGEYGAGAICLDCIQKAFKEMETEVPKEAEEED